MGGGISVAMEEVLRMSEKDFSAGHKADVQLALIFASGFDDQDESLRTALSLLRRKYTFVKHVIATVAHGVIGNQGQSPVELEALPSVSLTLAQLEGTEVSTFSITGPVLPDADASPLEWEKVTRVPLDTNDNVNLVLLASPSFAKINDVMAGLDFAYPEAAKLGGLISGPPQRGAGTQESPSGWLIVLETWTPPSDISSPASDLSGAAGDVSEGDPADASRNGRVDRQMVWGGCVGLVLKGRVRMEPLIAQGCRPLSGETYSVEKAQEGVVFELATTGKFPKTLRPMEALSRDMKTQAPGRGEPELQRMVRNLTVAVAPDDFKPVADLEPQDFLVRPLMGFDQSSGAMGVGGGVRLGQRIRFMVRDREGARQDLMDHALSLKRRQLQARLRILATLEGKAQPPAFGALVFTCNGRGMNLYGEPNYDSATLASYVPVPLSGIFCNGEIGQVGNSTYLHGFTAAVGILREDIDTEEQTL
ncbi:hypothetical protein COCSUDRAFT_68226 [Coccomyxa subellipsoidea C-169]|uniref:FIST C-domain domain-containing protein n=1 Tax=Coccomyxa subellipsoidea (strain C-169) TaxID=574566 RepID=I0YJB8_COCSC|nr:hypothetical protein COCSUDRAFT_68226 [Coccomyxa subellipsoidea C-169]EIE18487.1 hypothetical protein COCSUDRAFT_68226 [Coccomyxa subellipsoidea C-169]|eukprot:XP_005643031.1 hypothetical protein COCSUDRAFT_68226 [Coccomyxa subellipsoidea C-169]